MSDKTMQSASELALPRFRYEFASDDFERYLEEERGSIGVLTVNDRRAFGFFSAAMGLGYENHLRSEGGMLVKVLPAVTSVSIFHPLTLIEVVSLGPAAEPRTANLCQSSPAMIPKESLWLTRAVLQHPHAWDLIDGDKTETQMRNLLISLANSGIVRVVDDREWLARCLLALIQPDHALAEFEILDILAAAAAKQRGRSPHGEVPYDPGRFGPLPLGHTACGRYAFFERIRQRVAFATANQIMSPQYLAKLGPGSFWGDQFTWRRRFNASWAGEALMTACLRAGRYTPEELVKAKSCVRKPGIPSSEPVRMVS